MKHTHKILDSEKYQIKSSKVKVFWECPKSIHWLQLRGKTKQEKERKGEERGIRFYKGQKF